jgi:hypothetical protein
MRGALTISGIASSRSRFSIYQNNSPRPIKNPAEESQQLNYDSLLIEFPRALTYRQRQAATHIICYWAKLPYVANGSTDNKWLSPSCFWIDASSRVSTSSDWQSRDVFKLLNQYLYQGTPKRKRHQNTRKCSGIGIRPSQIILNGPRQMSARQLSKPQQTSKAPRLLY